jgi:hypothetical protein
MIARLNDIHGNDLVVDQATLDEPEDFAEVVRDEITALADQVRTEIEDEGAEDYVGSSTYTITVEVTW